MSSQLCPAQSSISPRAEQSSEKVAESESPTSTPSFGVTVQVHSTSYSMESAGMVSPVASVVSVGASYLDLSRLQNGSIDSSKAKPEILKKLTTLAKPKGVKVHVCVGGWGKSAGFLHQKRREKKKKGGGKRNKRRERKKRRRVQL